MTEHKETLSPGLSYTVTPGFCDYHLHSSRSDGRYLPDQVLRMVKEQGCTSVCLTDHNVVNEDVPGQILRHGIEVLPGSEFSSVLPLEGDPTEIHVVGWNIRPDAPSVQALSRRNLSTSRDPYLTAILDAVYAASGVRITLQQLKERVPDTYHLGRQHIARLMKELDVVPDEEVAFQEYIGGHGKRRAYVNGTQFFQNAYAPTEDVVRAIHRANGLAILCHTGAYRLTPSKMGELLAKARAMGFDGLECDYGSYTEEVKQVEFLRAAEYGLTPSAGSDFHGYGDRAFKQGAWTIALGLKACWEHRYGVPFQNQALC